MFSGNERIISRYRLKEKDDLTDYSDDIELVFVELPKFTKELDDLESLVDKWLYFLKAANKLETVPPKMGEVPAINHAFLVAQQSKLSRKELELLEKREMFLHDNRNAILKAQQQGRLEGEQLKALEIAQALLDLLDEEIIAQKMGLTVAQVRGLK